MQYRRHECTYVPTRKSIRTFMSQLVQEENGCITWPHGIVYGGKELQKMRAAVFAWFLREGKWNPVGTHVCTSCSTRNCVHPDHLVCRTKEEVKEGKRVKNREWLRAIRERTASPVPKLWREFRDDKRLFLKEIQLKGVVQVAVENGVHPRTVNYWVNRHLGW